MYRIGKRFTFDAAHQLPHLPLEHKCARLHGHTYTVEVQVAGDELDDDGFVIDYGELGVFKRWIDDTLDHRNLNDVMELPTTAEHMAAQLYVVLMDLLDAAGHGAVQIDYVEVRETGNTWSRFEP